MNNQQNTATDCSISARLKAETSHEHDRMEVLMAQAKVFDSRENYIKFTLSQYYFQKDIEHLYTYPEVSKLIPDLEIRGRSEAALKDLKDLDAIPKGKSDLTSIKSVDYLQALGWIYVSEGSTLGAAFLFKEAQSKLGLSETFGASNLAAYPEGRMRVWKRFKQALDQADFTQDQQNKIVDGALQGFAHFGRALENIQKLR